MPAEWADRLDLPPMVEVNEDARGTAYTVSVDAADRISTGISATDPHQGGRRLQLAVYGVAARQHAASPDAPVRADYWFTSAKGRWEKLGYDITDEVLAEVSHAMSTIVGGIEGGH